MKIPGTVKVKRLEKLSICSQTPFISLCVFLNPQGFILERMRVNVQEKIKAVMLV